MPWSFSAALFAPLVLTALAAAQQIDVTQGPLTVGQTIEVGFRDPGRANGSVIITIDNGDPADPEKVEVEVRLDANGTGSTRFVVPDWWYLHCNGGGAKEVTRLVEEAKSEPTGVNEQAVG